MSRTIDERVVEMKFDNKQFEGGIKDSLVSLAKLEDVLRHNISSDSIDNISKAASNVDLSGLVKSVESISDRFSTFGIIGMRVIENLVDGLMNGLGKAINSVVGQITQGGLQRAMNIENAHFQLQGIIDDEKEVQAIMKQASESVDGTAYSYDVAAKAASMFAATGIKSGEQMEKSLKGIAGVAATTNSDYESVAQIFTKVAGNGRVMGDELLQLSNKGLNAAATLKDYINKVNSGAITASDNVKKAIENLGVAQASAESAATARTDSLEREYEAATKQFNAEYDLRKKTLDKEYKALQDTLNKEYNARKAGFDQEYKALQSALDNEYKSLQKSLDAEYDAKKEAYDKEYSELSKSLDAEITAQQKANSQRIKEANAAYSEDVSNYRKAAEEKIALIDKEYNESLKLIDEELYKRTKAIDDQIDAINAQAEAEEKAEKETERATKLAELEKAVTSAQTAEAREKAQAALLEYQKKIAKEQLAESRKAQIKQLNADKAAVKEEIAVKKENAKEKRDTAVKTVQDESNATLTKMAETHSAEMEALQEQLNAELQQMQESKNERLSSMKASQNAELNAMRENHSAQLEALKDSQSNQLENLKSSQNTQLEALKAGQDEQLEAYKEKQNAQLEALKETNSKKLKAMKSAMAEQAKAVSGFSSAAELTEADIRDMVSKGLISFDLFSEAMATTFGDHAKDANHTFTGAMANIKAALSRTGAMFYSPLIEQDGVFVQFFNVIREKINDFNAALGATNGIAQQFTDWVSKIVQKLTRLVEGFKIANTYTSTYADGTKKVFESVNWVMKDMGDGTEKIVYEKMYTPFHALQSIFYTLVNVLKGVYSVLKPVGEAFYDVFLATASADSFYEFIEKTRELSENFKLSTKNSENLKKLFTGLFSVVKALASVFVRLIKGTKDTSDNAINLGDSIFDLIGWVGDLLTKFADWINTSPGVERVLSFLGKAIKTVGKIISNFINTIVDLSEKLDISDILSNISDKFQTLGEKIEKITGIDLGAITQSIKDFISSLFGLSDGEIENGFSGIGQNAGQGFINGLGEKIQEIIQKAQEIGSAALQAIKDFLGIKSPSREFEEVGRFSVEGLINGITGALGPIKETAIEMGKKLLEGLADGASKLISVAAGGGLVYILINIGKGFKYLSKMFNTTSRTIARIPGLLSALRRDINASAKETRANAFLKMMKGVALGIAVITGALILLMKNTDDPKKLVAAGAALGIAAGVIIFAINKLMQGAKGAKTVDRALNVAAAGLKSALKNLGRAVMIKAVTSGIKDVATAIGIVVATIAGIMILYNKDQEGFKHGMEVVADIAAMLLVIVGIMTLLGQLFEKGMTAFAKVAAGVLALSLAILVSVTAMRKILDLDFKWSRDYNKVLLLAALFGLVTVLALAIGKASKTAGKGKLKTGPLLAMCALILSSVWALQKVIDLRLHDDWPLKLAIFAGIFIALSGLVKSVAKASKESEKGLKGAATILAMCAFIATAVTAIAVLALFPADDLLKGSLALGTILLALAIELAVITKMTKDSSESWKVILSMCLLIGTIVGALAVLTNFEWSELWPGAVSLGIVLLTLAVVFAAVSKVANEEAYVTVITMIGLVAAAVIGLAILSKVESWENLIAAAVALGSVLLAIAEAFKILGESQPPDIDQILEFLVGILGVAAIAQILRMVSDLDWDTMLAAGGAISAVLLAIAETFKILNSTEEIEPDKMWAFIVGCIGAGIIGYILSKVSDSPWDSLLGMGGAIASVLLAMAVSFRIMDNVKVNTKAIAAFIGGCIAVAAIGYVISQAASQPWEQLLAAGISISIVILAMSLAMLLVAGVGELGPAAFIGIAALDAFIVDLTAILAGLGALTKIDGFDELIKAGGGVLTQIGKSLGDFVGSIIEGIGESVGRTLENIGKSLSKFMENAQPFFDGLKGINAETAKSAGALAGAILAISAAEFLDGISNLFSIFTGKDSMASFGKKLGEFGKAIKQFDNETRGIDGANFKNIATGAGYLIDMAKKIPNTGGLISKVTGDNDIGEFGRSLNTFGSWLKSFDAYTKGITDPLSWETLTQGVGYLIDMASKIPNTGGLVAAVTGDNDIGAFGHSLNTFAYWLKQFNVNTKSITDPLKWLDLSTAVGYWIDWASKIPNTGGLVGAVTGDNDIGEFGHSLSIFGYWLKSFNGYTKDVEASRLSTLAKGIEELVSICKNIEKIDNKKLVNFGQTLSNMAKDGMSSFIKMLQRETPKAITQVKSSISSIVRSINNDNTVNSAFEKLAVNSLNKYIKTVSNDTSKVLTSITTLLSKILSVIKGKDKDFESHAKENIKRYLKGIEAFYTTAKNTGEAFSKQVIKGIESTKEKYKDVGKTVVDKFIAGFKQTKDVKNAAEDLLDVIKKVFDSIYDDFKDIGEDAGDGFRKGLDNKIDDVADKAKQLAQKARDAIEDELDINSPSRVLRKDGNYAGQGFALGLLDRLDDIKRSAGTMANQARDSLNEAISGLVDEIDANWTIRPVVDLTNVTEAADDINSLFKDALDDVGISVSKTSSSMNKKNLINDASNIQNENGNAGTNVTFNQYNNSPKALSRIDIYRQTRNQLTQFREAIATR